MPRKSLLISSLTLSALLAGCATTGPNTQQGAAVGATLGAIAGAIIGNNSNGGGNGAEGAIIGALAGGILGGTAGNAKDAQQGTHYVSPAPQAVSYYPERAVVHTPAAPPSPPAPLNDVMPPSPDSNALWVPGYWDYNGSTYTWTTGHWEIPPPMATTYVASHWETRGNANVFVRGYWR